MTLYLRVRPEPTQAEHLDRALIFLANMIPGCKGLPWKNAYFAVSYAAAK
jgi:hypothetical protein